MPAVLRDSMQGLYRPDVNSGASSNYGPVSCLGNWVCSDSLPASINTRSYDTGTIVFVGVVSRVLEAKG